MYAADIVNSPEVTFIDSLVGVGLGGTPTGDIFGGTLSPGVFGPNFEYLGTASTPEPGSWALLTAAGMGSAMALRRKRKSRA